MTASSFSERTRRYLADIVEDSDRVASFVGEATDAEMAADEKTILAIERLFQRITEAVIRIGTEDMLRVGPDLPVAEIRAFGNRLRHEYDDVDPRIVLLTARRDLPVLRAAAAAAMER